MTRHPIVRATKYGNVKVEEDGYTFDSKAEAARYRDLKLMAAAGIIERLEVHPRYTIEVNEQKICTYVADFTYRDLERDCRVIEDVKGVRTEAYKLKKRLMAATRGLTITEVTA